MGSCPGSDTRASVFHPIRQPKSDAVCPLPVLVGTFKNHRIPRAFFPILHLSGNLPRAIDLGSIF